MKVLQQSVSGFAAAMVAVLVGCGASAVSSAPPAAPVAAVPVPAAATPAPAAESGGVVVPAARVVELPARPGPGNPRDVAMLVDIPGLKLATIVLRRGTLLPTHQSERAVTIVALQGAGTVTAGTESLRIDATHAVVLAPNQPHAVQPDAGTDLVLLVHHVGAQTENHQ